MRRDEPGDEQPFLWELPGLGRSGRRAGTRSDRAAQHPAPHAGDEGLDEPGDTDRHTGRDANAPPAPAPAATAPAVTSTPAAASTPAVTSTAAAASAPEPPVTWTIPQVAERIGELLREGFPETFWLVGEAVELDRTRRKGGPHWYFCLVDAASDDDRGRASISVRMWRNTIDRLFGRRGRLTGVLEPADGVVLRVLVSADFYAPKGELGFIIKDVDPDFTLGQLDRQRRELLRRLAAEGALERNRSAPLPDPPLRIGLVTSRGSAAHRDFLHELLGSGLGFQVLDCDARTQGAETGAAVCRALAVLVRRGVDVVCLVRGGGSRVDLAWFDREDIARAIASCPVPVLTGIGHETDRSVADDVAYESFKTPTKVAGWLVERARAARDAVEQRWDAVRQRATDELTGAHRDLVETARRAQLAAGAALLSAEHALERDARALPSAATRRLERTGEALASAARRLARGAHTDALARHEAALGAGADRLGWIAGRALERGQRDLDAAGEKLRLLDPRAVLRRGYAWLRRADGTILKDAAAARRDEPLSAVLRDGELDVVAREAHVQPSPPRDARAP